MINCPHCQTSNPDEARFCLNCGRPLRVGTQAEPALTAPVQGTTRPSAPITGERRMVTVLFADVTGFTAMSEQMEPEEMRALINACFDHLVPIVEKYGGVVDKFIGDEIMALFGAPVAHEDDPARALRAALEMVAAMTEFNAGHGTTMDIHIGINTGLVFAGAIGSKGRQAYTVMGDAVNLASRLENACQPGEILVGPASYRFTAQLCEFEALAPIQVKGKSEATPVYKLLGLKAQPGPLRGLAGLESPMVGRDAELATLLRLSETLQAGQGGVALIIGDPGLGKSRLIAEWRTAVRAKGTDTLPCQWAEGHCLSYGQGLAYHLLTDLLRSLIGVPSAAGEPETRAALQSLTSDLFGDNMLDVYPYLGQILSLQLEGPALEQVRRLDPQALQTYYLTALRQLLKALAGQDPLTIILEDTHWADPSSTELLSRLLPWTSEFPLLLCAVTRPDQDAPGWKLVAAAHERMGGALTEIVLGTLSDRDSRQLIANLLEIEALPEHIRTLILKRAEGNPFFVEEVIRMLIDRGAIVQENGHWAAGETIDAAEIPDNLRGLLLARIDRLPDDVKHTLRVASVIGRQFAVNVLGEVLQGTV